MRNHGRDNFVIVIYDCSHCFLVCTQERDLSLWYLCAKNVFRLEGRLHSCPSHTVVVLLLCYTVSEFFEN